MATMFQPTQYRISPDPITKKLTVLPLLPAGHGGGSVGTVREKNGTWVATARDGRPETEHPTQDEAARSLLEGVFMRLGGDDEDDPHERPRS